MSLRSRRDRGIWELLLPDADSDGRANKPTDKVYWAYVGRLVRSQGSSSGTTTGAYPNDGDATDAEAAGDYLAADVPNKAFVVFQGTATADDTADPPVEASAEGPHVYYWDEHDTFSVGSTAVSMALFETILSHDKVTVDSVSWTSYNYNRPNDRAHWTISCS